MSFLCSNFFDIKNFYIFIFHWLLFLSDLDWFYTFDSMIIQLSHTMNGWGSKKKMNYIRRCRLLCENLSNAKKIAMKKKNDRQTREKEKKTAINVQWWLIRCPGQRLCQPGNNENNEKIKRKREKRDWIFSEFIPNSQ